MDSRYIFQSEPMCQSASAAVSFSSNSPGDDGGAVSLVRTRSSRAPPPFLMRMAVRISRSRWFTFLRRVFHYQNGSRSNLGSNPFDNSTWMMLEFMALVVQIGVTTITLAVSKKERPVWPMRIWNIGYDIGCVLNMVVLFARYRLLYLTQSDGFNLSDLERQRSTEDSRYFFFGFGYFHLGKKDLCKYIQSKSHGIFDVSEFDMWSAMYMCRTTHLMNRCRTSLELFFAVWFVMGNVWVFDSRFSSFTGAPKLHVLCISLLAWNAISYSFPFLLFVLLCCCVPLISSLLGYNMNMGSIDKGASDDQISQLPSWRYKEVNAKIELANDCDSGSLNEDPDCCICLAKYRDKEEVRQLPCSHMFHLNCVDHWLRIISCCPLCKQELQR